MPGSERIGIAHTCRFAGIACRWLRCVPGRRAPDGGAISRRGVAGAAASNGRRRLTGMVRVKICGVTTREDALLACELGADAVGLNFFPESPRCISPHAAERIVRSLPPFVAAVGVFVNWKPAAVVALAD